MENQLSYMNDTERLAVYNTIVDGCKHLWSKGKLQEDRLETVMASFVELAEKDPYFLAHFTSYAINKLPSKDLKVVATFVNALSDADGTPFSAGSEYKKPNLRTISQAAIQELDPKLVGRVIELANRKVALGSRPQGTHFPRSLKTAIKKYLKFREANPKALVGIKRAGLSKRYQNLYRNTRTSPSNDAARTLGWAQKGGNHNEKSSKVKSDLFDFEGLSNVEIAEKIRANKLAPTAVLGALPGKITPVIAAAVLEQATGDQAVILTSMLEEQGLLKNKDVKAVYNQKIASAKNALDRVEKIKTELDSDIEKTLKSAKSVKRKKDVGDIGKIFLHLDVSSSMSEAVALAIETGSIFAECVSNPEKNFHWGLFNDYGRRLPTPESFEKEAFMKALYGIHPSGMTDCLALYKEARTLGCDVDVYITDQDHNGKSISRTIQEADNAGLGRPKAVVVITVGRWRKTCVKDGFEAVGIPVTDLKPEALQESALVSQAVKTALLGANAVIDEIMKEPLLTLPKWWCTIN